MRKRECFSSKTTYTEKLPPNNPRMAEMNTEFIFDHSTQRKIVPSITGGGEGGSRRTMNRSGRPKALRTLGN